MISILRALDRKDRSNATEGYALDQTKDQLQVRLH